MTQKAEFQISLVIPAYQAEETLSETLDAALAQDFESYQIVVVDDGSRDGTLALAQDYAKKYSNIKVIHQENKGTGGAYNTGVLNADGSWIAICSADDVLYSSALSTLWSAHLAHPEMGIIASNGDFWYENGAKKPVYDGSLRTSGEISLKSAITECFFSVGALYDKTWFEEVGGYTEGMFAEDYDFWLRIMMRGARAFYVNEILSAHRISSTQKSANVIKAYQTDIGIYQSCLSSGLLSEELAETVRESVARREQMIATHGIREKHSLKQLCVNVLADAMGRDKLEHMIHKLKGK